MSELEKDIKEYCRLKAALDKACADFNSFCDSLNEKYEMGHGNNFRADSVKKTLAMLLFYEASEKRGGE